MDFLIKTLLYIITMFFGGASLGGAISNYKDGKYGGCGMNIMFALTMIKLMFAI
jgi:hypothetical protein